MLLVLGSYGLLNNLLTEYRYKHVIPYQVKTRHPPLSCPLILIFDSRGVEPYDFVAC